MNYLEEMIFENSASEEMIKKIGINSFNHISEQIKAIDDATIKQDKIPEEAFDFYFPIDDATGAFEYLNAVANWAENTLVGHSFGLKTNLESCLITTDEI